MAAQDKKDSSSASFPLIRISRAGHEAMRNLEIAAVSVGEAKTPEEMQDAYSGLNLMREKFAMHLSRVEQMANEAGALGIPQVVTVRYR